MVKHNQDGAVNGLVISLVMTVVLLIGAISFGAWAYSSQQDYKKNSDAKAAVAADVAKEAANDAKEKEFLERVKEPYKTYEGPDTAGSLVLNFPKTWSGYVDDGGAAGSTNSGVGLNGYFSPGVVPSTTDRDAAFALRIQVVPQAYASVLEGFGSQQQAGKLSISAYVLPKLPKIVGVQVKGELADKKNVTMVVLPLRGDTLEVWTEGSQYIDDFNNHILPNLSFSP